MSSAPPPIHLQPLGASHASLLQAVYDASAQFLTHYAGRPAPADQAAADLNPETRDEARHLLGVFFDDAMAGVIDLRFGDPSPLDTRLGLILLTPAFRGQGIGGWALRILEAWLSRDTPVERVVLSLPAQNHSAQRFFLAHGYRFTGESTRQLAGESRMRLLQMGKSLTEL